MKVYKIRCIFADYMPKKLNNYRSSSTNMIMNRLLSQLAVVVAMQIKGALTWFTGANSGFQVLLPAGAFSHITLRNAIKQILKQ